MQLEIIKNVRDGVSIIHCIIKKNNRIMVQVKPDIK
jgi:hypothetical protein